MRVCGTVVSPTRAHAAGRHWRLYPYNTQPRCARGGIFAVHEHLRLTKIYMIAIDALPNSSGVLDDDHIRAIAAHLLYLPQPSIKSEAVGLQLHDVSGEQALQLDTRGRSL